MGEYERNYSMGQYDRKYSMDKYYSITRVITVGLV